jgi:modulator of drug activity B
MKNILIINAHQKWEGLSEGKLNERFQNEMKSYFEERKFNIKATKIESGYSIDKEIDKHEWADLIITQTPVFWFNTPWIHKKYIEEVFTKALSESRMVKNDGRSTDDKTKQYGTGGLMKNKKFMLSTTWNAPQEAFEDTALLLLKGKSADDILVNVSSTYKFCGFEIVEGFHAYDVIKNPQIETDILKLKEKLSVLTTGNKKQLSEAAMD